jgi:hypothetical protein
MKKPYVVKPILDSCTFSKRIAYRKAAENARSTFFSCYQGNHHAAAQEVVAAGFGKR